MPVALVTLVKVASLPLMRLVVRAMSASSRSSVRKEWQGWPAAGVFWRALRFASGERSALGTGALASGGGPSSEGGSGPARGRGAFRGGGRRGRGGGGRGRRAGGGGGDGE